MSVIFEGEVKIMINRHRFMGDGITLTFPEFVIYANLANKFSVQFINPGNQLPETLGTDYETIAEAYLQARLRLGYLEYKDGVFVAVEKK